MRRSIMACGNDILDHLAALCSSPAALPTGPHDGVSFFWKRKTCTSCGGKGKIPVGGASREMKNCGNCGGKGYVYR